jgi:hypothetical protein
MTTDKAHLQSPFRLPLARYRDLIVQLSHFPVDWADVIGIDLDISESIQAELTHRGREALPSDRLYWLLTRIADSKTACDGLNGYLSDASHADALSALAGYFRFGALAHHCRLAGVLGLTPEIDGVARNVDLLVTNPAADASDHRLQFAAKNPALFFLT